MFPDKLLNLEVAIATYVGALLEALERGSEGEKSKEVDKGVTKEDKLADGKREMIMS